MLVWARVRPVEMASAAQPCESGRVRGMSSAAQPYMLVWAMVRSVVLVSAAHPSMLVWAMVRMRMVMGECGASVYALTSLHDRSGSAWWLFFLCMP